MVPIILMSSKKKIPLLNLFKYDVQNNEKVVKFVKISQLMHLSPEIQNNKSDIVAEMVTESIVNDKL